MGVRSGVRVFDGSDLTGWTAVRLAGGVIEVCGDENVRVEGDEVVDGRGGTLLPGLIDAHVHLLPGCCGRR